MKPVDGCQGETYAHSAALLVPATRDLRMVRDAALGCKACHLWQCGTQTVFGVGPSDARLMLIGEQPGDGEDKEGHPFVGPAGKVLDEALAEAGIDRAETYVTNAVKHFKWVASGTRRLHQKPNRSEIVACKPWLDAEMDLVDPDLIVLLGATAAQSVLGPKFRLTQNRGQLLDIAQGKLAIATIHPSAILRMRDTSSREEAMRRLVGDLNLAAQHLTTPVNKAYLA